MPDRPHILPWRIYRPSKTEDENEMRLYPSGKGRLALME
jgi:hypothetical protein